MNFETFLQNKKKKKRKTQIQRTLFSGHSIGNDAISLSKEFSGKKQIKIGAKISH